MNRYSMHINDTFCLVLAQNWTCPKLLWDFGNSNDQNTLNLSKNVLFEVSFN